MPRVSGLQKEAAQTLPPANVIEFRLEDDNKVIFRPSGTEPKVKAYLFSKGTTRADSEAVRAKLQEAAEKISRSGSRSDARGPVGCVPAGPPAVGRHCVNTRFPTFEGPKTLESAYWAQRIRDSQRLEAQNVGNRVLASWRAEILPRRTCARRPTPRRPPPRPAGRASRPRTPRCRGPRCASWPRARSGRRRARSRRTPRQR